MSDLIKENEDLNSKKRKIIKQEKRTWAKKKTLGLLLKQHYKEKKEISAVSITNEIDLDVT